MFNCMTSSKMIVRRLKEKCKDAARMRREKERSEFVELSKLLPLPSSTTSQLDRASIIRLTSSYLRIRAAFPKGLGENWGTQKPASSSDCNSRVASYLSTSASSTSPTNDAIASAQPHRVDTIDAPFEQQTSFGEQPALRNSINQPPKQQNHHQQLHQTQVKELGSLILQTLDGFVFALHSDGKIMYISETASVLLGLPQIDLTGGSIFDYVHPSDHNDLIEILGLNERDGHEIQSQIANDARAATDCLELGRSFSMRMKCILPRRNAGLIQNGYKSIHCTGYLKVKRCQQPFSVLKSGGKRLDKTDCGYNLKQSAGSKACNPRQLSHFHQSKGRTLGDDLDWESYALVAVGYSLLPSASTEIKLNGSSFMFRANLDMKIIFMETSALDLLGHNQDSVVGQSLYQLVHVADLKHLEEAHRALLNKGQVVSKYLRLMRQDAGSLWIQMQATQVNNPRCMPKPIHIVGICLIIGEDRFDQSQLLLDETSGNIRNDFCMRMNATYNLQANTVSQANKRRYTARNHSSVNNFQAIKDIAARPISSNNKRVNLKRKDKSDASNKRIRQFIEDNQNANCKVIDKDDHGTLGQIYINRDKKEINERNQVHIDLTHNQPIGQLRRFSDDTCSVASSITLASTTSASNNSNIGQFTMSCPPSSITSGCSFSSSSPLSFPTTMAPSASQNPPIQPTPPTIVDMRKSISQVEPEVNFASQNEPQHCCTRLISTSNPGMGQIIYMDPSRCQTSSYWTIEADTQSNIDRGRLRSDGIQNQSHQPLPGPNYYNLDEQQKDIDDHSSSYYYYNNNEATFYDGSHNANLQLCSSGCGSENFVIDQFTPHQYSYLADNKSTRESINMTTMKPALRSCFVANQSF